MFSIAESTHFLWKGNSVRTVWKKNPCVRKYQFPVECYRIEEKSPRHRMFVHLCMLAPVEHFKTITFQQFIAFSVSARVCRRRRCRRCAPIFPIISLCFWCGFKLLLSFFFLRAVCFLSFTHPSLAKHTLAPTLNGYMRTKAKNTHTTGVVPTIILVSPAIVNVKKATTTITVIAFSLEWFISCVMRAYLYFWALDSLNAYNKYYYFISLSLFRFFLYLLISNISLFHLDKSWIWVLMNFYQEIHSITLFMVAIKN